MQFLLRKAVVAMAMIAILTFGCSSDRDRTPTPAASLSGTLSQTYVKGATIFADKIVDGTTLGNYTKDSNEVDTISDDGGQFDLYVPAGYDDYVLVSLGGLVEDASGNSVPARPMLAPAGARNITPVTTLAALNPDLATQIGEDYDADIANPSGVSGKILQLAKTAEAILDLLCDEDNQVVTDMTHKFAVLQHVADAFDNIDLSDDSAVNAAGATAVNNILDDEEIVPADTFADANAKQAIADSFSQTIETITTAIDESADSAKESDILDDCEAAVDSGVDDVHTGFKTVSTKLTAIQFLDSNNSVLDQIQIAGFTGTKTLSGTLADQTSKIAFGLFGNNDYAADTSYPGASISVTINDANSLRKATVECTNVDIIVTADGRITITISDTAQLEINGTNTAGEQVLVALDNNGSIGYIVSANDQSAIIDFDALSAKIEAVLGSGSDLFEIARIGDYVISIKADGVPFAPFAGEIIVE